MNATELLGRFNRSDFVSFVEFAESLKVCIKCTTLHNLSKKTEKANANYPDFIRWFVDENAIVGEVKYTEDCAYFTIFCTNNGIQKVS